MINSLIHLATDLLYQGQYAEAAIAYEQAIAVEPTNVELYWHYGIALLLSEQEEAAQSVWMTMLLEASSENEQANLSIQLVQAIDAEARRCETRNDAHSVWILRRYQSEFAPDDPLVLRDLVMAGLWSKMISLDAEELQHFNSVAEHAEILFEPPHLDMTGALIQMLLAINPLHPVTQHFISIGVQHVQDKPHASNIIEILHPLAHQLQNEVGFRPAAILMQHIVQLDPTNVNFLRDAIKMLIVDVEARQQGVHFAERLLTLVQTETERLHALEVLLVGMLRIGGQGQQVQDIYQDYKTQFQWLADHVESLSDADVLMNPEPIISAVETLGNLDTLITAGAPCLYFEDDPKRFRHSRNRLAAAVQAQTQSQHVDDVKRFQSVHNSPSRRALNRPLRIGYLADTFRQHSVGWLCRWLLLHHDRERFDVHLYTQTLRNRDFVQTRLMDAYGDRFHVVPDDAGAIANCIFYDEIDILVELDDLTRARMLGAVALKPAPIQVAWLGFDAPGLPAVDYFIADPYVVPDDADQYYQEKIWRLPNSYIAVDGFEVYTPTLQRSDLKIPDDAVVYLSSQTGLKRNPHNVKLQLQILKAVPNSYFLIKSLVSDPELLRTFFYDLANEVGVSGDRLRFMPDFPLEFTYRANLQLADVVLDTYPYGGATTTLEALWIGLPIVTRVGEQFAARNSYTLMINAGISEGIAWSDDEYVDWGIRIGKDENLRRDITWKLHQSRHTAPLWNAKQFAREMENAYEQMWNIWCEQA